MTIFVMFFVLEQSKVKREKSYYKQSVAFVLTVKFHCKNQVLKMLQTFPSWLVKKLFYWPKGFVVCTF